jgi:hypothetical protein
MARSTKSVEKIHASCGNAFADLGLPDAEDRLGNAFGQLRLNQ